MNTDGEQWLTVLVDYRCRDGHLHVTPVRVLFEPTFTLTDYVACCVAVAPGASAVTFI